MGLCPCHVFHPTAAQCSVPLCTLDYLSCDRSFQVCVLPPTARRLSAAGSGPALPGPAVGAPVQQRAGAAVPVGWPLLLQPRPDSLGGGTAPAPEQATDFGVGQCLRNTSNKSYTLRVCVLLDTSSCYSRLLEAGVCAAVHGCAGMGPSFIRVQGHCHHRRRPPSKPGGVLNALRPELRSDGLQCLTTLACIKSRHAA